MGRVFLNQDPFFALNQNWRQRGTWPAWWIDHPERPLNQASVACFRLHFMCEEPATLRFHISADNRYHLYLDAQSIGRGPELGDPNHWRFETYAVQLAPGAHCLVAQSWWLGSDAPYAQMSVRPGFILAAEGEFQALSTGVAAWQVALMPGITFHMDRRTWGTGAKVHVDGTSFPWGWEHGSVGDWQAAIKITPGIGAQLSYNFPHYWSLLPATLPPMLQEPKRVGSVRYVALPESGYPVQSCNHLADECPAWQEWLQGEQPLVVPPNTQRQVLIDLGNYYCAYPHLLVSHGRGSRIRLSWAEALYESSEGKSKGNRDVIEGKYFIGVGDEYLPDGDADREFTTLWWEVGRYVELWVETGSAPLELKSLTLMETRYPLSMAGDFTSSDERMQRFIPIALRGLQMCAHETYMDCPYYEQLMYAGDTRLEVLTTYAITQGDRLPRKALMEFDHSRLLNGLTQSRYPSKVTQIIPPFSLWWVCMVHDYWLWRNDNAFVKSLLPGVRSVMEGMRIYVSDSGLLGVPRGWNFFDWVPEWNTGIPPQADQAPSAIFNLQFILALSLKAQIEAACGEPLLAQRDRAQAQTTLNSTIQHFWCAEQGLFADDLGQEHFSEHAQCLAVLTGLLPEEFKQSIATNLLTNQQLARTTIYFSHYLFETYYMLDLASAFMERLSLWFDLERQGLKTTVERPEPTRSDCHGWGAHPLYHYYASVLGIRPAAPGFAAVRIAPMLGSLQWAQGTLPHPAGTIAVHVERAGPGVEAEVSLPAGVSGTFVWHKVITQLQPGMNSLRI